MIIRLFTISLVLCAGATIYAQASKELPADFARFLVSADAAQVQLQNRKSDAYKALWSNADDVTLSGGFGGKIEKGWAAVSARLDWAASQFNNGTNTIERVSASASGDLGYLVQIEHIKFKAPAGDETSRDFRVTMIFRKERGKWRIIHRHADGQTVKVPA